MLKARGGDLVDATFLVNREADFFVLREGRMPGVPGVVDNVGARIATARAPENPIGNVSTGTPTSAAPALSSCG